MITVLLFLPCITCIFWLALNPLIHIKDNEFRALELFLAVTGIALFADAGLTCTEGSTMLSLLLIKQFSALLIIPVALAYIRSLSKGREKKSYLQAFIAIPFSLIVAQIILLVLTGAEGFIGSIQDPTANVTDKAAKIIYLCSFRIFYAILAVEITAFIFFAVIKFIKGDRNIRLINTTATAVIYAVMEISVIQAWPTWGKATISVILTCILFTLSYSGLFREEKEKKQKTELTPDGTAEYTPEKTTDIHQGAADEETLRIKFEDLIVSEQLFLKQGIRLADIASMLDTNRTYVSRLVNNTYNMSFSDYINTLRIDYAEQYLLHHRDAKQSDIATACGFPNAPAFNNVFKKITGVTPKVWLATNS